MARCRSYLRGLSICVTVLLLVSGVVMIGAGFASMEGNTPVAQLFEQLSSSDGLLVLQVFGPVTVVFSVIGICAATLDLKPLLLVFSVLVFVEFVAMMVVASPLVQVQSQMDSEVEKVFLNVTPLHSTEVYIQRELNKLQTSDSCCGLRSYEDWKDQLPASCFCTPEITPPDSDAEPRSQQDDVSPEGPCVMAGSDSKSPNTQVTETLWVHSKPCGPILKSYMSFPIRLRIGIISAFSTIAIAAIALCLALGLEEYWKTPTVQTTVDDFNRVKYQPKPSSPT
ncbi:23 kDa integral membrane protein-like [Notolabrus celidotus]|uniref:23 kDa integral membrane protein-like n=1 Tax=Notolabrus celidotus TaxID=1203425 RepID=UPI0014902269|nr:23 kDa integral membrane protein-like [Notolabrus celidotus]